MFKYLAAVFAMVALAIVVAGVFVSLLVVLALGAPEIIIYLEGVGR